MNTVAPVAGSAGSHSIQGAAPAVSAADAHDFGNVMNSMVAAPWSRQEPSAVAQLVLVPTRAWADGLHQLQQPPPEGMTAIEAINFGASQQIQLTNLKTLQGLSNLVIRTVRKDVETVLNSK